jgi:colicin import membrane protein
MFGGAGLRRAVVLIAAALLFVVPARAQSEADAMVEKFAREADRAQARKAEPARKSGDEARTKKEADRKAAQASKSLEVRKRAEAQRAKAVARRQAEETRAVEEEEMLARARREAGDADATAEIRRLIEEAEGARIRAEETLAQEAEQARIKTAEPVRTEGEQNIERIGQEAQRRARQDETERATIAEQALLKAARTAEHRHRLASLKRVREVRLARLAAQARHLDQEAEVARARADAAARLGHMRAAENRRLIRRLARVREVREARLAAQTQRLAQQAAAERAGLAEETRRVETESQIGVATKALSGQTEAQPPAFVVSPDPPRERPVSEPFAGRATLGGEPDWRVTVLMIMTPGTYGIRRGANIADPVLCTTDGCYVSVGADRDVVFMPRRKALGVGNTLGARAGACRQSLSCVFRGVALDYPAVLQPVDLHILKHDRRRPQRILADSDCRLAAGRLTCSRGIYAEDYVLWIVPERLAEAAGPETLEGALRDGLSASRSADASPRPMR